MSFPVPKKAETQQLYNLNRTAISIMAETLSKERPFDNAFEIVAFYHEPSGGFRHLEHVREHVITPALGFAMPRIGKPSDVPLTEVPGNIEGWYERIGKIEARTTRQYHIRDEATLYRVDLRYTP